MLYTDSILTCVHKCHRPLILFTLIVIPLISWPNFYNKCTMLVIWLFMQGRCVNYKITNYYGFCHLNTYKISLIYSCLLILQIKDKCVDARNILYNFNTNWISISTNALLLIACYILIEFHTGKMTSPISLFIDKVIFPTASFARPLPLVC